MNYYDRIIELISETARRGPTRTSKAPRDSNVSASQRRISTRYYREHPGAARRHELAGRALRQMLNTPESNTLKDDKK